MLLVVLGLSAVVCAASTSPSPPAAQADDYRSLYEQGATFVAFLANAEHRRKTWHDNYDRATVADTLLQRARQVGGQWHLLVVAEDRCGDSANTIPYLAKLVELVDGLDLRIVDSQRGRSVMESHRTPDGRAATPTVLLLDATYAEVGCWVERPTVLREWFDAQRAALDEDELYRQKYAWYDRDAGRETVKEVIELLEAAGGGEPRCASRTVSP